MAQKAIVENIDDIDGTEATHIGVEISFDGVKYEIDLSAENYDKVSAAIGEITDSARRIGGRKRRTQANGHRPTDASQVREWAQANGFELAARGRIPANVVKSYHNAKDAEKATSGAAPKAPAKRRSRAKAKTS